MPVKASISEMEIEPTASELLGVSTELPVELLLDSTELPAADTESLLASLELPTAIIEHPAMSSELIVSVTASVELPTVHSELIKAPGELPLHTSELSATLEEPSGSSEVPKAPAPHPKSRAEKSHADSLSHLLPANTFAQISPRCYIFPGAEVTLDNMEGDSEDSDDDCDDSEDEDEEENETSSTIANEIIVPDIDNVLSNEVPLPEVSPTPTSSSLSPTPSASRLHSLDHEIVENITGIEADDASADLEPAPFKRPRLESNAEKVF